MEKHFSPKQVARAIGVSEASLKRWVDKGVLSAVRTAGGHRRIPLSSVVSFLRETERGIVEPGLLGLPATTGSGDTAVDRAVMRLRDALHTGNEEQFRGVVLNLFLAGKSICKICDEIIAPAFTALGDEWQHGDLEVYQERRGCEITMRTLYELRSVLPKPSDDAPYAIGGTLEHDPYTLATTMIEVALIEAGWRAESHGSGHPVETLCAAVRDKSPRLVWVSSSAISGDESFSTQMNALIAAAGVAGAEVVYGGRAITDELASDLSGAHHCENLAAIVAFARGLTPAAA